MADEAPEDRLESWKEIAGYLRRDVTTVQRWEKREGLPVHRHVHDKLGSVYAFKSELDVWRRRNSEQPSSGEAQAVTPPPPTPPVRRPMAEVAAVIAVVALIGAAVWLRPFASEERLSYELDVSLHRAESERVPLGAGARVVPGDQLYLSLEASRSVYVYVVNEDDRGEAYLLFPVPSTELTNPLPANERVRLPGTSASKQQLFWQVTSAGGREHFYVLVSPERLASFERLLDTVPPAESGRAVLAIPMNDDAVSTLRGVGGMTAEVKRKRASAILDNIPPAPPLEHGRQQAKGLWVRQLTLDNPAR